MPSILSNACANARDDDVAHRCLLLIHARGVVEREHDIDVLAPRGGRAAASSPAGPADADPLPDRPLAEGTPLAARATPPAARAEPEPPGEPLVSLVPESPPQPTKPTVAAQSAAHHALRSMPLSFAQVKGAVPLPFAARPCATIGRQRANGTMSAAATLRSARLSRSPRGATVRHRPTSGAQVRDGPARARSGNPRSCGADPCATAPSARTEHPPRAVDHRLPLPRIVLGQRAEHHPTPAPGQVEHLLGELKHRELLGDCPGSPGPSRPRCSISRTIPSMRSST